MHCHQPHNVASRFYSDVGVRSGRYMERQLCLCLGPKIIVQESAVTGLMIESWLTTMKSLLIDGGGFQVDLAVSPRPASDRA